MTMILLEGGKVGLVLAEAAAEAHLVDPFHQTPQPMRTMMASLEGEMVELGSAAVVVEAYLAPDL